MKKLTKAIRSGKIRTITVDIFDTVLLRKTYPEELQFLKHAERGSALLKKRWNRDISPFYFYSFRQFARRVLARMQYSRTKEWEVSILDIFAQTIESIAQKESVRLGKKERDALVDLLVQEELAIEKESLKPNHRLISALRSFRKLGARVFFVSDMYLETEHIQELLRHFGIDDAFDGGVSSASAGCCKWNGGLFSALKKGDLIPGFSCGSNLHIGDNRHADTRAARALKMKAIHYRSFHTLIRRPVSRMIGILKRKILLRPLTTSMQKKMTQCLNEHIAALDATEQCLFRVGYTLAPAVVHYLSYIDIWSRVSGRPVYFISSEATTLHRLSTMLNSASTMYTLPALDRLKALHQFLFLGLEEMQEYDPVPVLWFLNLGSRQATFSNILERIGIQPESLPFPKAVYEEMPRSTQLESIGKLIKHKPLLTQHLQKAHEQILRSLQQTSFFNERKVIVADVGWSGTIQGLLEGSMELLHENIDIEGIYLGRRIYDTIPWMPPKKAHGTLFQGENEKLGAELLIEEIWEYAICASGERKHQTVLQGLVSFFEQYRSHLECAPDFVLGMRLQPLRRLFSKPSLLEAKLIGSIKHHADVGSTFSQSIVQFSFTRAEVLRMFFLDPPLFQAHFKDQFWQEGFLCWYKIRFLRPFLGMHRRLARMMKESRRKKWQRTLEEGSVLP